MAHAVVTRDAAAVSAYAPALAALGLEVVAMPVTTTAPPADPGALARALAGGGYAAIACASARAAAAVLATGVALPEVWAVGPATARVFADAGVAVQQPRVPRDGAALAAAMCAALPAGSRVLLPRAAEGREEAAANLRAGGLVVDEVVAYATVARAAADPLLARGRAVLAAGGAVVCVVFAPSQVAALVALGVPLARLACAAIGETTAAALREAGAAIVAVAAGPTPAGIANAVAAVYPPRS